MKIRFNGLKQPLNHIGTLQITIARRWYVAIEKVIIIRMDITILLWFVDSMVFDYDTYEDFVIVFCEIFSKLSHLLYNDVGKMRVGP